MNHDTKLAKGSQEDFMKERARGVKRTLIELFFYPSAN
jgi:hypothetical protein